MASPIPSKPYTPSVEFPDETAVLHARLAAIVESSDDAIISKNFDGIIVSWNASAQRIFGYSPEEAIGKHISLIIPPDRYDEETEIISKIRAGQRIEHFETIRQTKDGRLINLSITVSPVRNSEGKIVGASKVARDITERTMIENQIREQNETLETLNRLAPALAASLDLQSLVQIATDEATKVIDAQVGAFFYNVINEDGDAFLLYTMSGARKESFEHLGMPRATEIFAPTFRGEGTILLDDVTQDPRYGQNRLFSGMPQGHPSVKSYLAVPVVSRNSEVIGGLFFGHEQAGVFTERDARIVEGIAALAAVGIDNARLYDQVKAGEKKALAASRAKSDFLATMSHEIRTPMNAIVGISRILGMSNPLTPKQADYIRVLQSSADSLLVMINDLLDISKIEARTVELEKTDFSLAQIIEESLSMMSVRAKEKNLQVSSDLESIRDYVFVGDPIRIRQIINNLCSNAVKFTEAGSVTVRVFLQPTRDHGVVNVSICVEDTGIGIPEEKQVSVFEKFVQADTSISRKYGGTGLGLAITKMLADLMGGTVGLESKPGIGSIFTVTLPLQVVVAGTKATRNADVHPADLSLSGSKKGLILLVEDYEPNILVAAAFLETMDYTCEVACNGRQALEKIMNGEFSVVLMDVQMPDMSGLDATQLIRKYEQDHNCPRVPIIGLTAHAMAGDRERCLQAGMDEYLPKPYTPAELKEKIESVLKK